MGKGTASRAAASPPAGDDEGTRKLKRKEFERELERLQIELCKLQDWVRHKGLRVVVVFEGRDAAGKGGVIKRITEWVSPRVFRVVALPAPTEREKTQWYYQRYVAHLPAAGEVVLFDRSWYNRAGVERVMGFCTDEQYREFLRSCPAFERDLIDSGITLIKYWFDVGPEEQMERFRDRVEDPTKQWKRSPMDVEALRCWYDYSRAQDAMFQATDTAHAPWWVVRSDDQRRARLNCIANLLSLIPYEEIPRKKLTLPPRQAPGGYRPLEWSYRFVPERY